MCLLHQDINMYHTTYQQTQNIKTLKGQISIRKFLDLWLASICVSKGFYVLVLGIPNISQFGFEG